MSNEGVNEQETIANSVVIDLYRTAADISNRAVQVVIDALQPGTLIKDACAAGDDFLLAETAKVYSKSKYERGIGFPTSIAPNNIAGNFSPSDDAGAGGERKVAAGDVVKIDLGAQIDGYVSCVAHTVIVGAKDATEPATGRSADVVCAAYKAAEVAVRMMTPGKTNTEVTEAIAKVASAYGCEPVHGTLSHRTKRFIPDGNDVIIGFQDPEYKVAEFQFEPNTVYHLDVAMTTGSGKVRERQLKTTIFKRNIEENFQLKLKASRSTMQEINTKFYGFPFSLRLLPDVRARLGVSECLKHNLLHQYPVLEDKEGEFVAQFKYTVFVRANGVAKITGLSAPFVKSDKEITDQALLDILAVDIDRKAPKKKKKKAKKPAAGEGSSAAMETE